MRVEPVKQITRRQIDNTLDGESRQDFANHENVDNAPQSRAVVAVTGDAQQTRASSYRSAIFLAHLIATRDQAPQTRECRRASAQEAAAAYRGVARLARG